MESGKFRARKQNPYSQISNHILVNNSISLKAKGLYALIVYYLSIPGFVLYRQTLINSSTDGETAFRAAWKELKDAGYLIQHKLKKEKGVFCYEYELLDFPNEISSTSGFSTSGYTASGEATDITNPPQSKNLKNKILPNNNKEDFSEDNQDTQTNENLVVVSKEKALSGFTSFFNEYLARVDCLPEDQIIEIHKTYNKCLSLIENAPKKYFEELAKADEQIYSNFFTTVKMLYFPDEFEEAEIEKKNYIHNKEGYIYGCLGNWLKTK